MDDHASQPQAAEALAAITRDHRLWYCWEGTIPPIVYARIPKSSPPVILRAASPEALRAEIEAWERGER